MAAYEYDDFWVEFSPRAGGGYAVAARAPDGETSKGSFQLPFTNDQLEAAVRTLGYTRAATTRDIGEVTTERRLTAEQLGGELADALLVGPTGDLYTQARSAAIAKGRGVRLWLSLGKAPGLLSVPWEFLYLQPTFLASQRKTPIVRFLSTHAPVAPRRIEDTVRILGVVASPDGLPKLEVAQERKRVDDALTKARQEREVTIDWLDPATPKALRLALQKGEYHILHFVGHSGYVDEADAAHGGGGGGVLFLENADHSAAQVSDAQLVNLLGDQDSLRLVVLNSCEGARTSVVDPFAGIATSIVALGIPAVVAMQFEISDKAAITFAEELYQSLIARQDPIDVAVAEARKAVFTEVNETEWATPVLFLRNEDGRLFDFAPVAAAVATATVAAAVAHGDASGADIAATSATTVVGTAGGVPPAVGQSGGLPPEGGLPPAVSPAAPAWTGPSASGGSRVARPLATTQTRSRAGWIVGGVGVAVVAVLFAAGMVGAVLDGLTATDSPASSSGFATETPSETDQPSDSEAAKTPSSSTEVETPIPPEGMVFVPGATDEWVGPREKSNLLAVAGGPSSTVTNISTVRPPEPGATPRPAGVATDKTNVLDRDPAWDPRRGVIAFARYAGGSSEVKYVVPGVGRRPDGKVDGGISVKDPITEVPARGTQDHAPAWRGDGNLLFARTRGCATGPDCIEDIVLSTFGSRLGDYILPTSDGPSLFSADWSEVRNISVDPGDDNIVLVTGRNLGSPGRQYGVWIGQVGGVPMLLSGSERATDAVFTHGRTVVAIEQGEVDDWGPALLVWSSVDQVEPQRLAAPFVLAGSERFRGLPSPDVAEFNSISRSPFADGRYAVLVADLTASRTRGLPAIVILDVNGQLTDVAETLPPPRPKWATFIGLGW